MNPGRPCMSATMLQSREIVRMFKLRGLGIGKEALSVLSGHLATCSDAQAEIVRVIQCIKASGERAFLYSMPSPCNSWGNGPPVPRLSPASAAPARGRDSLE